VLRNPKKFVHNCPYIFWAGEQSRVIFLRFSLIFLTTLPLSNNGLLPCPKICPKIYPKICPKNLSENFSSGGNGESRNRHLKAVAAYPARQRFQRSGVAGGDGLEDGAAAADVGLALAPRRTLAGAPASQVP
jgi:hypothetical protein